MRESLYDVSLLFLGVGETMGCTPAGLMRRGAAMLCCLGAVLFLGAGSAQANFVGSYHDFSALPLATQGPCSVCHTPHETRDPQLLWVRQLSQERGFLTQTSDPNYLPDTTLACYDCHATALPLIDDDPLATGWVIDAFPQDIAFTDNVWSLGGTKVGYYEKFDAHLSPQDGVGPVDGSPTGGHFWKRLTTQITGTPTYRQGDKIACSLCHDPHNSRTGTNQAFFRRETSNGQGGVVTLGADGLTASNKDDLTNPNRSRHGTGTGREMCAACHGYASPVAPVTLWGNLVPAPPTNVSQHQQLNTTPCVKCHQHNKIVASCRECHGYPPLNQGAFNRATNADGQSYPDGAGAHQRHKDALGDAIFSCEICHGPDAGSATWHNQNNGVVLQANVDLLGQTAYWGAVSDYVGTGSAVPAQTGYAFQKKGGGDQRCSGLVCHGSPPNVLGALNWTDNMLDGDGWRPLDGLPETGTGSFTGTDGANVCRWCHDATPARIGTSGITAPNVLGDGTNWGAEINGHGLPNTSRYDRDFVGESPAVGRLGAGKDCAICHDARYRVNPTPPPSNTPWKTHFDGSNNSAQKRLKGTDETLINNLPVTNSDGTCFACHQNAGADAGTQVSSHGNDSGGGYVPLEPTFCRSCRQCHDVHGANWNGLSGLAPDLGRNLHMIGSWLDADNDGVPDPGEEARVDSNAVGATTSITVLDNPVVFTSRTGANSFDENDGPYNPADDLDDVCATCHVAATGGGVGTGGGGHDGLLGPFDMRGEDCMQCHDHDFDNVPDTCDGIAPSRCEGCHGLAGAVHRGRDGVQCTPDDAPNVMTVHIGASWVSVWDGTWWDTQQGGNDSTQQGGHGDPDGREGGNATLTPICQSCHNSSYPPGQHLNGTYNSMGTELPRGSANWSPQDCSPATPRPKANANANTAHLQPAYFGSASGNNESWQLAMDAYCYQCHAGLASPVPPMTHELDGVPAAGAVQLGTHLTRDTPLTYMTDADLATGAVGLPNFAPCVSCHNPHGSMNTDSKGSGPAAKNRMLIDDWSRGSTLCANCHI